MFSAGFFVRDGTLRHHHQPRGRTIQEDYERNSHQLAVAAVAECHSFAASLVLGGRDFLRPPAMSPTINRRALLLVNRHARQGQANLDQSVKLLRELGIELFEESTDLAAPLPDLTRRYRDKADVVIMGGGDGT